MKAFTIDRYKPRAHLGRRAQICCKFCPGELWIDAYSGDIRGEPARYSRF
jgi:hypothetical protein